MTLTLEWACGFEQFGNIGDINQVSKPWAGQLMGGFNGISTTTGVRSLQGTGVTPQALNLGNYGGAGILWKVPDIGTRYIGMGWYMGSLPTSEGTLFQLSASPTNWPGNLAPDGVNISVDNLGVVRIRQNSNNTELAASNPYSLNGNTQYWLSISCNPHSGWVTVALNGTIIATTALGINFSLQYITFVTPGINGGQIFIDDLVSYSSDGSDTAATLVPPRSVWTSLPNAVGDETQWSRVGGAVANWASVDGQGYQTATYNTTNQTGTFDYYNTTDLPGAPTVIDGVVVTACARKEDSGDRDLKLHARVDGVDDVSVPVGLTTGIAFWYLSATFTQAPGNVPWTASTVNLCQLGLEAV